MIRTLFSTAILAALAVPALAETSVDLDVLRKYEVVNEQGETEIRYEDVSMAVPGELLVYCIQLTNTDDEPATSVGMTLPIHPAS